METETVFLGFIGLIGPILTMFISRWLDKRASKTRRNNFSPRPKTSTVSMWSIWYGITLILAILGLQVLIGIFVGHIFRLMGILDFELLLYVLIGGNCLAFFAVGFMGGKSDPNIPLIRVAILSGLTAVIVNVSAFLTPAVAMAISAWGENVILIMIAGVLGSAIVYPMLTLLGAHLGSKRKILSNNL